MPLSCFDRSQINEILALLNHERHDEFCVIFEIVITGRRVPHTVHSPPLHLTYIKKTGMGKFGAKPSSISVGFIDLKIKKTI